MKVHNLAKRQAAMQARQRCKKPTSYERKCQREQEHRKEVAELLRLIKRSMKEPEFWKE